MEDPPLPQLNVQGESSQDPQSQEEQEHKKQEKEYEDPEREIVCPEDKTVYPPEPKNWQGMLPEDSCKYMF